jgi:pyridoxamine 5'-phosphate oxidase
VNGDRHGDKRGEVCASPQEADACTTGSSLEQPDFGPGLREEDIDADAVRQFQRWYDDALQTEKGGEPSAMALATATREGMPSVRMVLLRGIDDRGFTFFTNYESRKARELEVNPFGALVFYWPGADRQVRVEGRLERASEEESDRYFKERPSGARLGAWASPQSEVIPSREWLDNRVRGLASSFPAREIPRPPNWGGYRLVPNSIEFWQGRPDRLHDRLRYRLGADGAWLIERLAP